jgi:hypothetical protein
MTKESVELPHFSESELLTLRAAIKPFEERAKHVLPIDYLLKKWVSTVQKIEHGYDLSIQEYVNDISSRNIIYKISSLVDKDLSEKIYKFVSAWDIKFNEATKTIAEPLVREADIHEQPWWFRIPKKLVGDLRDDLISEGLVSE